MVGALGVSFETFDDGSFAVSKQWDWERVHLGYLKTFEESSDWFSRHLDCLLAL